MLLWFEFGGLRKGPGRPQKLDFELFRAVFEHFRTLLGLENGPPEPPGKQAKTGPQGTRHRARGDPGAHFGPKKASKRAYCFGWTFLCLKMTLQAKCLEPLLGSEFGPQARGFTVHGQRSQFTVHGSRCTVHGSRFTGNASLQSRLASLLRCFVSS